MAVVGPRAADEGLQAFDTVDQTLCQQKIKRTIDCRRSDGTTLSTQPVEQFIGAVRPVVGPDQFEHAAAYRGKPYAAPTAESLSLTQGVIDTGIMIMKRRQKFYGPHPALLTFPSRNAPVGHSGEDCYNITSSFR